MYYLCIYLLSFVSTVMEFKQTPCTYSDSQYLEPAYDAWN